MTENLHRKAFVFDRQGNIGSQGIFYGKDFDHLVGKNIEMERKPLRELTLCTIYDILVTQMINPKSREINNKELIQLMSMALKEPRYNRKDRDTKLEGRILDQDEIWPETVLANIYSGPDPDGIRVELLGLGSESIIIDLTQKNVAIKIKRNPKRTYVVMGISQFLEQNYCTEETGYTEYHEEDVEFGRDLDDLIFWQKHEQQGGDKN